MDKRIALQLFGQLRFWPEQKTIIPFVDKLKDDGYSVDIYGTFWNDEYTRNLNTHGKLDIFSKLNLIEEPDNALAFTLEKYYYCLSQSNLCRSKEGIDYDLIIAMRPDLEIKVDTTHNGTLGNIFNILDKINKKPVLFHVNKIGEFGGIGDTKMEDKIIIANPLTMDKLNNIYSDYDISKDVEWGNKNSYFEYHKSLLSHIKKLDIIEIYGSKWRARYSFEFNLMRHRLHKEMNFQDDSYVDGVFLREKAKTFQDYNSLVSWIERMKKNLI